MYNSLSKSRVQCKTSQGIRRQWSVSRLNASKPTTSHSRRTQLYKTQTPMEKAIRAKDSKIILLDVCNEIDKVFPKQRFSVKSGKMDFPQIRSERMRIAIMQLQYILVKKRFFDQDIKEVMVKLALKINTQLDKGRQMADAYENFKNQNSRLKQILSSIKDKQSWKNYTAPQSRQYLKSAAGRQQSKVILQNSKLQSINKDLMKIIEKNLHQQSKQKSNQSDIIPVFDWRAEQVKNKISYLQLRLSTEEKNNEDLLHKIEVKDSLLKQIEIKILILENEYQKVKQQKMQWMQRSLMHFEDHRNSNQPARQSKIVQQSHHNLKKLASMRKQEVRRNSNLQIKNNYQRRLLFGYQVDFFRSIRTHYLQNKATCYNKNIRWRADQLGLNYEKIDFENDNQVQQQLFPLPQLSFYRPSFYSFVEHLHKKQNNNYELSRSLIQKMRCIMQSKLNQFLIFENVSQYSYFPEFVFAWFKKYYFDSDRNCIIQSMCSEQSGYQAFKFYKDLMNVKLDQTWEVVTFRQFLLEQLSLQELYFYLQCQNMLFKKSGVTQQTQYLGQFIILVKYSIAKMVLDVVLNEFDSWNVQFLINKMNQKVVMVKNQQFIESAFFLRCLLQYYKIERMNRYKYIRKTARQLKENQKFPTVGYLDCMKILSKFPDITQSNRLTIYRDCYSVGRGVITPEIIFTVCSQSRIFLKNLKIKSFYKLPIQNSKTFEAGSLFCLQPPHPYLYRIFIKMKTILNQSSSFSRKVMGLGVEQLSHRLQFYRKYFLQWKSFSDNSILKCKHFLHFVKQCLYIVSQVNYHQIFQLLNDQGKLSHKININLDENQIGEIYAQDTENTITMIQSTVGLLDWKNKLQKMRENVSAKKIQRMVRKKFIQPYVEVYNLMFDKVKKIKYFGNVN